MPIELFNQMWLAITVIEAQEALARRGEAAWPHISQAKRDEIHKELFTKAYPATMNKEKPVDLKELFNRLQAQTGKG
jgi:hypothetical protein